MMSWWERKEDVCDETMHHSGKATSGGCGDGRVDGGGGVVE